MHAKKLHSAACFCSLWYAYFAMKCITCHSSAVKSAEEFGCGWFSCQMFTVFPFFKTNMRTRNTKKRKRFSFLIKRKWLYIIYSHYVKFKIRSQSIPNTIKEYKQFHEFLNFPCIMNIMALHGPVVHPTFDVIGSLTRWAEPSLLPKLSKKWKLKCVPFESCLTVPVKCVWRLLGFFR